MIDVMRMGFSKEHLLKMTEQERGAFLLFGYTGNQVNVLWKVIIASLNRDPRIRWTAVYQQLNRKFWSG